MMVHRYFGSFSFVMAVLLRFLRAKSISARTLDPTISSMPWSHRVPLVTQAEIECDAASFGESVTVPLPASYTSRPSRSCRPVRLR